MPESRNPDHVPEFEKPPKDASAETIELDRIARQLGELLQGGASLNRKGSWTRCHDVLRELGSACGKSEALRAKLADAATEIGGSEHVLIRFTDEPERIFKATFDSNFG